MRETAEGQASMRDVVDWFDGASRVLFVHAHPDDARAKRKCPFLGISRTRRGRLGLGGVSSLDGGVRLDA